VIPKLKTFLKGAISRSISFNTFRRAVPIPLFMPLNGWFIKWSISVYRLIHGGAPNQWYVGISRDPERRLFEGHNVDEDGDRYIYREAYSSEVAREVESHFVENRGFDGGDGGGDEDTVFVYAYKKTPNTDP
jgi:hypothetical protein